MIRPLRARSPIRFLVGAALALAAVAVLACAVRAGRTFYYVAADVGGKGTPSPFLEHPEQAGVPGMTDVQFESRDGTLLRGWYAPSRNGAAVVVTSGTDANRAAMLPEIRIVASDGFGVLAFDWPGTGLSAGKIDWNRGAPAALEAAVDWLAQRPDQVSRIGALGFSAGATVTLRVAVTDPRIRAMILTGTPPGSRESPAWFHLGPQPLQVLPTEWAYRFYGWPVGRERPIDLVGKVAPRPVLLVGGTADRYADPEMSQELFAAAREPKELWIAPGAVHGNYAEVAPQEYARRITEFLERYLAGP